MEDLIVDSEILHSGEDRGVEQWLEPQNKSFCLRLLYCLYLLVYHSFILVDQYSSQ